MKTSFIIFTLVCILTAAAESDINHAERKSATIYLLNGFTGHAVRISIDKSIVYEQKAKTIEVLGLADSIGISSSSNTYELSLFIIGSNISTTKLVNIDQGRGLGISLRSNQFSFIQKDRWGFR